MLGSIGKAVGTLTVEVAIPVLTNVLASIGIGTGALAVPDAIPVLTDVLGSIGKGVGTLAVDTVTAGAACLLPPALHRNQKPNNAKTE
jgi:hypothetical protein